MFSRLVLPLLLSAASLSAQPAVPKPDIVKTGLFMLSTPTGNALLRLTPEGGILVDGPRAGEVTPLTKLSRRTTDNAVRASMVTEGAIVMSGAMHFGPIEVKVIPMGAVRSAGDTAIYFADLKVVAAGRLLTRPAVKTSASDNLEQWKRAVDALLQLDFDTAIPAIGPAMDRAAVERFRADLNAAQ